MKYSNILRNVSILAACWLCPSPGVLGQADPADPDVQILQKARVGTDGPALIAFISNLSGNDAALVKIDQLIADLDGPTFKKREQVSRSLVALGPAAYAALMRAKKSSTPEIAARASACAKAIYKDWDIWLRRAAVRRLLELEPDGTVQVLLRYLPYAADEELEEQIWFGVDGLAKRQPQLCGLLAGHLRDTVPSRRALAACILGHRGELQQRLAVQQLLQDPNPGVRLRAAQGLLAAKQKAAIPVLIALLEEPQVDVGWQAEELLHWVAGYDAPGAKLGAGNPELRKKCGTAWAKWWSANKARVDLDAPLAEARRPGLMLDSEQYPNGPDELKATWLWGCDGSRRWELKTRRYCPVRFLPGNRVLAVDWSKENVAFSERDLEGNLLWQPEFKLVEEIAPGVPGLHPPLARPFPLIPRSCQRLPNGDTAIINRPDGTFQLDADGQVVYLTRRYQLDGSPINCDQLLPNGRVLCRRYDDRKRTTLLVQLDPRTGAEHQRVEVRHGTRDFNVYPLDALQFLKANHYLLPIAAPPEIREIDCTGQVVWRHPCRNYGGPIRLPGGNTLLETLRSDVGSRLVEVTPDHKAIGEVIVPRSNAIASRRLCFSLVRLGFDAPIPGNIDLASSVTFRMKGLRSKNLTVRQMSAYALQDLSTLPPTIIPELIDALDDADPWVRGGVSGVLAKMRQSALPAILKATKDPRPRVRACAVGSLSVCIHDNTDLVLAALINALPDENIEVRQMAVMSLRSNLYSRRERKDASSLTDTQVAALVQPLIRAFQSKETAKKPQEVSVPRFAAIILSDLGPAAAPAIPALITAATGKDLELRGAAIAALGGIGPAAKEAVPTLLQAMKCKGVEDPEVAMRIRRATIWALGRIGSAAQEAVPALKEALRDGDETIRVQAEKALQSIQRR
jgi:HEAT repeat protein